jgi:DNA (cytosine-5)-methyltransferase 1
MQILGIDLFSGAGGLSVGAAKAGVKIKMAIEAEPHAAATYAHNHPDVKLINGDIRRIKSFDVQQKRAQVILFGGPPCQGFSISNQRTRTARNPNNWLFREFLRAIKLASPDWVVFENVKGILETEDGLFLEYILNGFKQLGYTTTHQVLNAADYGVPQNRSRLFVVGSLHGVPFRFPKPTAKRRVTVNEAIADLLRLKNGATYDWLEYRGPAKSHYAQTMRGKMKRSPNHHVTNNAPHILARYSHIPQGGNWADIPARLMKNYEDRTRCHTGIYHRLRANEPSIVIGNYRKNMLIHPYQDRGLSVREAARLQSFPDWFEFKGSIGFQQQQVGNAVPPLLAERVFRAIASAAEAV